MQWVSWNKFHRYCGLQIYSLTFISCSRKLAHSPLCNYALLLQSTQYAELVNCSFCDNLGTTLAVINTNITLVGNNEFTGNHHEQQLCGGGGIGAFRSNLTFIGNSTFFKNFASSYGGGAIYIPQKTVYFTLLEITGLLETQHTGVMVVQSMHHTTLFLHSMESTTSSTTQLTIVGMVVVQSTHHMILYLASMAPTTL